MRLICGPSAFSLPSSGDSLRVVLYGQAGAADRASAGDAAYTRIRQHQWDIAPRAWDLLSIALSVMAADVAALRTGSSDGWTRELELDIAVLDPSFWNAQSPALTDTLKFLTTDRWQLRFHGGGGAPPVSKKPQRPREDSVVLLSGGLDSLVGATDLVAAGRTPFAVSQTVRGDGEKQVAFAARVGGGLSHLQTSHAVHVPGVAETSSRARSLIFMTFGILVATALQGYADGGRVTLHVCENGFIAINPPLTGGRVGSLSTRTSHPEYLARLQRVLDAAGLRVSILNPYSRVTKGEMLKGCANQPLLKAEAVRSTSCGRFQRFNYRHCGRCIPCQVRRAAFNVWGFPDTTDYVYEPLGQSDHEHAQFDDVRSVAMALAAISARGFDSWLGATLMTPGLTDKASLRAMLQRGMNELSSLHRAYGVK